MEGRQNGVHAGLPRVGVEAPPKLKWARTHTRRLLKPTSEELRGAEYPPPSDALCDLVRLDGMRRHETLGGQSIDFHFRGDERTNGWHPAMRKNRGWAKQGRQLLVGYIS